MEMTFFHSFHCLKLITMAQDVFSLAIATSNKRRINAFFRRNE